MDETFRFWSQCCPAGHSPTRRDCTQGVLQDRGFPAPAKFRWAPAEEEPPEARAAATRKDSGGTGLELMLGEGVLVPEATGGERRVVTPSGKQHGHLLLLSAYLRCYCTIF